MNEHRAYWGWEVVLTGLWAHKEVPLGCQDLADPNRPGFKYMDENLADAAQKGVSDIHTCME